MPKQTFYNLPHEKRSRLLSAAIRLFSDQPYQSTSITAIMRVAGVSISSFYQYFQDKKDLYLHILKLGMSHKLELIKGLQKPDIKLKTFEYLKMIIQASVQFEIQYPDLARIAYRAFVEEIPFPAEAENLAKKGGVDYFNEFLTQGVLHDDVAPWVDTDMAAYLFQTAYHSFGHYMLNRIKATRGQDSTQPVDVFIDPDALDLFNNLMDLLEAGMGRDPEIRKHYFSK